MPSPWTLDTAGPFVDRLLAQIVGFRIPIEKIEGKCKLNQNHPVERREKVIHALEARGGEDALSIAGLMRATLSADKERNSSANGSGRPVSLPCGRG